MKIDSLSKTSFEKVDNAGRSAETGLSITDSPMSLSSPFVNPYRKSYNTATISTGKGKTAAERNNNPFNIKFGNFAAKYGATKENKPALDGGSFATFSSPQVGFQAAKDLLLGKNYRNLTVDQAMKRWSNNGYGGNIFPEVANKRVADLNPTELDNLQKKQIVREDKKYANKLGIYKYGGNIGPGKPKQVNFKEIKDFYKDYLKSPNFEKRALNTRVEDPDELAAERLNALNTLKITKKNFKLKDESGSEYNFDKHLVNIDTDDIKKYNTTENGLASHEIAHAIGALNPEKEISSFLTMNKKEQDLFKSKLKYSREKGNTVNLPAKDFFEINHAAKPSEGKADMDALRFQLKKDGIYDTGTEEFTKDHLQKAKKKYKNNRFFKTYEDDGIIELMNTIVSNRENTPKYKYGGKLKSFNVGGTVPQTPPTGTGLDPNLVAMGLGLAGTAVESFDTNPKKVNKGAAIGGGVLKGAATGATVGSIIPGWGTAAGAIVGGIVGGIAGGRKANRRQATINHTGALQNQNFNQQLENRSAYLYRQMNPYQYKFGGNLKPEWEAEKAEIVQGNNVVLEDGKQITPNLHLVKGKKHEQGGTLGAGGDRVFSNSISFNGQTPAKVALKIGKQLQKFDSNLSSPDRMKRLTAEKMTTKLNEQLDTVFNAQEEFKETPKFKYGGNLPKFAEGGDLEADKRRIKTLENYLRDNPQESGDSKKAIRNEIAKLKSNSSISTGKPWNPLEKKKVLLPLTEKSTAWTNDLDAVTVKGKRSLPGNKSTSGNSAKKSVTPFKRNNYNSLNNVTTLSPRQSTNPLAKNLENIPVTQPKTSNKGDSVEQGKSKFDPLLATGLGLSAIGYLNSANNIRRMNTDAPTNLTQSPYYGYRDRSRLTRTDLSGVANTVLRDPNVSSANKQALFSRYSQGINQINDQENSNRFQYDNQFAGQALQVDARNNAMLTQAQQQRIANQNAKLGLQSQNFDSFLGNINTTLQEQSKRKLDQDKFSLIADSYKRKYNTDFDIKLP